MNGVPAPLLAVAEQEGQAQINFQVPHFPTTTNNQQLVIVVDNDGREQTFYVRIWADQLGIFTSLPTSMATPSQKPTGHSQENRLQSIGPE